MTQRSLAVLVVLNVVLLAALSVTVLNPTPAEAQFGANRQYTMIAGGVTGRSNQSAIYVIDLSTSRIAPLFYNGSSKKFEFFAGRSVARDMERVNDSR
ncbi:MAG: hypothetical protein AAF593_03705 [Planctomycetota bacterium]